MHVYPDIGLSYEKFNQMPRISLSPLCFSRLLCNIYYCNLERYWANQRNRKTFFDEIAREQGFDPLVAENWHRISHDTVVAKKVGGVGCG